MIQTYKQAGVDIDKGDRFAEFIAKFDSGAINPRLGGFAGGLEIDLQKYKKPVLLTTTDGVGTKLLLTRTAGRYNTIGRDLVAMCVNDLIVCGAEPLGFLDYIACSELDEAVAREIIGGVIAGCELAGCQLSGGETAEMPDVYRPGEFDLAGFAYGLVDKQNQLPAPRQCAAGDPIFGLPSVGVHANGLSLARKALDLRDPRNIRDLLEPTKIYVKEMGVLLASQMIIAAAHITGGGPAANIRRVIGDDFAPNLSFDWPEPEIFDRIRKAADIDEDEMRRVFNLGVGVAVIVKNDRASEFIDFARQNQIAIVQMGELRAKPNQ